MVVAVIGAENVGKSTLVNTLAGRVVSETSETPGTTKRAIKSHLGRFSVPKGVKNPLGGVEDFVIVDTAGLFDPERETRGKVLSEEKLNKVLGEIEASDIIVHMVDAQHGLHRGMEKLHNVLKFRYGKPMVVVINKVDLVTDERVKQLKRVIKERLGERPVSLSLLTGEGLETVIEEILRRVHYTRSPRRLPI